MQQPRKCNVCGRLMPGKRSDAKYCTNSCRKKAWAIRRISGQFSASAKILAKGHLSQNSDLINVGLRDREWLFSLPEFQGDKQLFDQMVEQFIFQEKLKPVIEDSFGVFENENPTVEEIAETVARFKDVIPENPYDFKMFANETFKLLHEITTLLKKLEIATRLTKKREIMIENRNEFLEKLAALYGFITDD